MSEIRVNNITNREGSAGPSVAGIPVVDSNSHFVVPTGRTGQRYADGGENIVRDGLVLYLDAKYSYPGATGTNPDVYTWYDLSGNENNGELIGGVGYNAANGGSLVFDGSNDYVTINLSKATIGSNLTFSIWIQCLGEQSAKGVFQIADGLTSSTPWVLLQRTNTTTVRWYLNGDYRITNNLSDLTYVNLTITYNGTTWIAYKNGISDGTYTGGSGDYSGNSTWLGNGYNGFFNGNIAQVSIYNRALTATEVLQNFNATRSRYGI
jgi:hypothetical protein